MANWYVDNAASGTNAGTSWTNAWHGFDHIVWGAGGVVAGDTLYISGGTVSKTYSDYVDYGGYTAQLRIGASGSIGSPITISIGQDAGHNGIAVLDSSTTADMGIYFSSRNYITITGQIGSGTGQNLKIIHAKTDGICIEGTSTEWNIHYVEITDNGSAGVGEVHGLSVAIATIDDVKAEIDHCIFDNNWTDQIHMTYTMESQHSSAFGDILFHHNTVRNTQDDGMECGMDGIDIYNNTFGPRATWTGRTTGHPDMLQMYGKYIRVFDNTFVGIVNAADGGGNSFLRWEPYSATRKAAGSLRIYNNLFYNTASSSGGVERGIEISPFGFGADDPTSLADVVFANNTLVRCWLFGMAMTNGTLGHGAVSGIVIENNLFKDPADASVGADAFGVNYGDGTITFGNHGSGADIIIDHNLLYASSGAYRAGAEGPNGAPYSTQALYFAGTGLNVNGLDADPLLDGNYAPQIESPVIGAAANLSTYFTTDKNGTARGAVWDIGAYEYESGAGEKFVMVMK